MVCWVAERALAACNVDRVIIATDSQEIVNAAEEHGISAVLTDPGHMSGTDRIAEVAKQLPECEIVVNVQGDEPLISPETISRAVDAMLENKCGAGIVTSWEPIESVAELQNPDLVKVVINDDNRALYFSRSPIPYPRDAVRKYGSIESALEVEPALIKQFRKHTGLYVYRKDVLLAFTSWPQSQLERIEALEQLRALEHGVVIEVIKASSASTGVDTSEDLERVRALAAEGKFQVPTLSY